MRVERTAGVMLVVLVLLLVSGPFMPSWLMFLLTTALAKGMVVLGLFLLMRTGLVSFGQGLYFGLGAYAAAMLGSVFRVPDMALMLVASIVVPTLVALLLGPLMAKYRLIFFGMLSLAFSMVLYGLLVNTTALGSTDGFNVAATTIATFKPPSAKAASYAIFALAAVLAFLTAWGVARYLASHRGRLSMAVRDNELRVEYLGASVHRIIYLNYIVSSALAGLGGGLIALAVGHVDPDSAYWSTSGEFLFVTILAGVGNVMAPFLGSIIFEGIRSFATQYFPELWHAILGVAMLLIIMFLPRGIWTAFERSGERAR